MKEIKTIKGYVNAVKRLADHTIWDLKGYDKLTNEQQFVLGCVSDEMSNRRIEIRSSYYYGQKILNYKTALGNIS